MMWWIDHFWQVYVGIGAVVGGLVFYLMYRSLRDDDGEVELEPEELRELILDNRAVQMCLPALCTGLAVLGKFCDIRLRSSAQGVKPHVQPPLPA